ncbi:MULTISPECIES: precorrin-2 dehydrogenase/sirohydrochlorin ferrochelatase family protein [Sphingobacterium]|jgi:precorrin-2 dehydrogenase / sirohydrochlorin ferrochelatase|uniref:Bifunctional precorrin-2 dehydrogenase/sirohydrochlorin ferrochelatase n=2 Tax=Sphingobacterium TaxID=28453 RepID=A0ACD5C9R4_9SPHI|nr:MULTISPECIES: bifunctional precorrin-2 dehydrogenase/sirohydrochlorin ferrochelatase [Sphingobacterium]HAE68422.1 bifunctional precorrin-2 dehydrogenase/sirohydrochlorin ferrochelatase [Sphingobacterium sp.]MDF2853194.1 siroheme synthase [Sphingobacterium multivorum]OFV17121.1 siroheme synthase [Sphingobacterium sp. HMSC13C05]OJZ07928.1 MAG: siroheme synthase [Sphingobacterium sp. 40-24]QRQ63483.1 bifunctional precorrin-2 dehydrogenase/sirohydrochlorin ferrochelatase [Sphingobacterium multi
MNQLFPIFVKLNQIDTLLVGGGKVALEKFQALISNDEGLKLTIVTREIIPEFKELLQNYTQIQLHMRPFRPDDLTDKQLVIAATNNMELNEQLRNLTGQNNILFNAADKPELCDFYLGSIVKKGDLKIAISTNGKSPTIAKRVKELLNDLLPEEIDETLSLMSAYREQLRGDFEYKVKQLNEHTKNILRYER